MRALVITAVIIALVGTVAVAVYHHESETDAERLTRWRSEMEPVNNSCERSCIASCPRAPSREPDPSLADRYEVMLAQQSVKHTLCEAKCEMSCMR